MLECYQAYADYHDMMDLVEELVVRRWSSAVAGGLVAASGTGRPRLHAAVPAACRFVDGARGARRRSTSGRAADARSCATRWRARACRRDEAARWSRRQAPRRAVRELRRAATWSSRPSSSTTREELSPARQGAPRRTRRWSSGSSCSSAGMEIANAFTELNDPDDQRAPLRGPGRASARRATTRPSRSTRTTCRALEYGMPPTGGRRASASTGWSCCSPTSRRIRDVILFPPMRPEEQ